MGQILCLKRRFCRVSGGSEVCSCPTFEHLLSLLLGDLWAVSQQDLMAGRDTITTGSVRGLSASRLSDWTPRFSGADTFDVWRRQHAAAWPGQRGPALHADVLMHVDKLEDAMSVLLQAE